MDILDTIAAYLPGTSLAGNLAGLAKLYRRVNGEIDGWVERSGMTCPQGCGTCCRRFEPDLLPAEADFLAVYLLLEAPDLLDRFKSGPGNGAITPPGACPLYRPESALHCSVYPARPLICRLFGFSASRDKHGLPAFRPCVYAGLGGSPALPAGTPPVQAPVSPPPAGIGEISMPPVLMPEAGELLVGLSGGRAETTLLRLAVPASVERIRLLEAYGGAAAGSPV